MRVAGIGQCLSWPGLKPLLLASLFAGLKARASNWFAGGSDMLGCGPAIASTYVRGQECLRHRDLDEARATAIMGSESNLMIAPAGGLAA